MLDLLREYAEHEELSPEPGFRTKYVRWSLDFDSKGEFLNIRDLKTENEHRGKKIAKCPHLQFTANREKRQFLVDSIKFIALIDETGNLSKSEAIRIKHLFFVGLLMEAQSALPELGLIARFLGQNAKLHQLQKRLSQEQFKGSETATFAIIGRDPAYLVEDPKCVVYWRERYKSLNAKEEQSTKKKLQKKRIMRCYCSGELIEPARTHPKITGLGGQQSGDALLSYNKDSFCSYFLEQSQNAALSTEMAATYSSALNHLIDNHSQQLAGSKVIHWYAGKTTVTKKEDPLRLLDDTFDLSWLDNSENTKDMKRDALHHAKVFLRALKSGTEPRLKELAKYHYYAMVLSANSGRVVVRDWMEGQFGELAQSILAWFQALDITNISGDNSAKAPKIERVITALLPNMKQGQKYSDWIKPIGNERVNLWHAALSQGVHLPYKVISKIVPLHQAFMLSGDFEEALDERSPNRGANLSLLYTRMGLLKAYHIRKGDQSMQPYLNEEHPNPAYHCGRLMAVYADLQRAALGDVGAGVVQRYYAAASATPALILGRLSRGSQFHLSKLKGALAHLYEQRLASIWGRINDELPKTLTLEEQSLFALGYYQQIASRIPTTENLPLETSETKGDLS